MFETDADRLAMIKSLGGQIITVGSESCWAIFDNEYLEVLGDPPVETRQPVIQCRSSDVERLTLLKDMDMMVGTEHYRIRIVQPDGTGMTRIFLKRP